MKHGNSAVMAQLRRNSDAFTLQTFNNNSNKTGDNTLIISKTDPYNARKEEKKEKRKEKEEEKKKEKTSSTAAVFCFDSDKARPATPPLPEACSAQNETLHRPFSRHAPCFAPVCTVVSRAPDRCKINFSLYLCRRLNVTSAHNEKETANISPPLYPLPPMESERVCHICQSGCVHHHRAIAQKRDGTSVAETSGSERYSRHGKPATGTGSAGNRRHTTHTDGAADATIPASHTTTNYGCPSGTTGQYESTYYTGGDRHLLHTFGRNKFLPLHSAYGNAVGR